MNNTRLLDSLHASVSRYVRQIAFAWLLLLCFEPVLLRGDFLPMPLTPESFNHDLVVERSAPGPVLPATTASMDTGWTNTGYSWYERGYNRDWPATGLRAPGTIITSDLRADHLYQLAPDYRTGNVAIVDVTVPSAALRLWSPAPYRALSLLLSGMHGGLLGAVGVTVLHQDGPSESYSVASHGWMESGYAACTTDGRVDVGTFYFSDLNSGLPKLFTADLLLTNTASPVTRIEFSHLSGVRTAVFALSGSGIGQTEFQPIGVSEYNADVIVEAGASRPQRLGSATTGSMESGGNNSLRTWFEQGYCASSPLRGLPEAGKVLTSLAAADHQYVLAASYESNNAILLDQQFPTVDLGFATPAALRRISFLTASSGGQCPLSCEIHHADGSSETNSFVPPDWFSSAVQPAWCAGACLNLNTRLLYSPSTAGPNLFGVDISLANAASPVTNITLRISNAPVEAHAVVFAVSGQDSSTPATRPVLTVVPNGAGGVVLQSTQPGTLEGTLELKGPNTVWTDEGPISTSRTLTPAGSARFWRVRQ